MYRFVIGRDADCHVILKAPSISRHHAYVSLTRNGKVHFEDAGSTNGSFLIEGGQLVRIQEIDLPPEASLQLGKQRISVAEILRIILAGILRVAGEPDRPSTTGSPQLRTSPGRR